MLARLRHHRLIGSDDEHGEVDTTGASQHVLDEALMTRDVDEGEVDAVACKVCETEIDCNPARLLFLQAVGIRSR
jgi:hypothetical protein